MAHNKKNPNRGSSNKTNTKKKSVSSSGNTTTTSQNNKATAALSQAVINRINNLVFTPVIDLSDYYSKIGASSSNIVDNFDKTPINTLDSNLIIISDKKVFKEYESKNDILYGIILKDKNDPDSSVEITYRYKKSGKSKMTVDQLFNYISNNMATKQDLNNLQSNMATKQDLQNLDTNLRSVMATKQDLQNLETKLDNKINKLRKDFNKLKKDNNLK